MIIARHKKTLLKGTPVTSLTAITVPKWKKVKWKPMKSTFSFRLPRKIKDADLCKKFLRLNDRKKYFYVEDFRNAGYHCEYLPNSVWSGNPAIKEWCNANVGPNWCAMGPWFIFQTANEALAFKMAWL